MQGVERSHMNAAIQAVLKAYYDLLHSTAGDALKPIGKYGKKDTLGMDSGPEITICEELGRYDAGAVVITEEVGARGMPMRDYFRPGDPQTFRTVYICDPTDRSNQLKSFLSKFPKEKMIAEIFGADENTAIWEREFSGPAVITGASSAISCVRRGLPIFTVILNYITGHLIVSCAAGNLILKLPRERPEKSIDLGYLQTKSERVTFPGIDGDSKSMRRFVTFLGDVGKIGYKENFADSGLMDETETSTHLHYGVPGGPARILYLSSLEPREKPIGFILANGEKIGEWVHWLSFIRFAKTHSDESQPALRLFEVYQDRPWTKDGILMSTPPNYSLFRQHEGQTFVDVGWLLTMPNPSQMRGTLIVSPFDNRWAMRSGSQSGYRSITF
jgi:hypothetical protein